ncbi:hypothetical protein HGG82_15690 [Marinomonas sp. M1K-6]|uniref:Copper resistance protein D n=1 Tax=Marinomonas profundi TaxID=2726122 RepID=A0A847RAI7_9GAMM|nr:CopD family protein [Marinomonas profundi]NLQ19046.1 hypothetical protein [Marinomonas profundi]UDV03658.1 CopD family protein [Marinomonas profundi]
MIGLAATIAYFFILVGGAMEESLSLMFDPMMVSIYWDSPAGSTLIANVIGYCLVIIASFTLGSDRAFSLWPFSRLALMVASLGIASLIYSFSFTGHATEQAWYYQIIFFTHILIAAWWLGLLFPLWLVARKSTHQESNRILERFGELAAVAVLILIICGAWMSYVLTGWQDLFSSDYGFWLLVKLALVVVILVMTAYHKLHLVPLILKRGNTFLIQKSILMEKMIASSILVVTAIFTTFVGPPMH